jgi:hypothetical protein
VEELYRELVLGEEPVHGHRDTVGRR